MEQVMIVMETFRVKGRGIAVVGDIECESLKIGDKVSVNGNLTTVKDMEKIWKSNLLEVNKGDTGVGILLPLDTVKKGDVVYKIAE